MSKQGSCCFVKAIPIRTKKLVKYYKILLCDTISFKIAICDIFGHKIKAELTFLGLIENELIFLGGL